MLRIYRTEETGKLAKLKKNKILPMTWCSLVNPNEDELLQVSTFLHIDYDILSNSLDADERSRIEQEKAEKLHHDMRQRKPCHQLV